MYNVVTYIHTHSSCKHTYICLCRRIELAKWTFQKGADVITAAPFQVTDHILGLVTWVTKKMFFSLTKRYMDIDPYYSDTKQLVSEFNTSQTIEHNIQLIFINRHDFQKRFWSRSPNAFVGALSAGTNFITAVL